MAADNFPDHGKLLSSCYSQCDFFLQMSVIALDTGSDDIGNSNIAKLVIYIQQ